MYSSKATSSTTPCTHADRNSGKTPTESFSGYPSPLPETKRQNRYILVIGDYFTKWMEALPPFSLMFGREATLPIDFMFPPPEAENDSTPSNYAAELRIRLEQSYHSVRQHMSLCQQHQKELYDKNKTGSPLKIGDKVWLHSTVVRRGKSHKFHCLLV